MIDNDSLGKKPIDLQERIKAKALFSASGAAGALLVFFLFFIELFSYGIFSAARLVSGDDDIINTLVSKFGYDKVNWILNDAVQLLAILASAFLVSRVYRFYVRPILKTKPSGFKNELFIIPIGLGFSFAANFLINTIIGFFEKKGASIPDGEIAISNNSVSTLLIMAFAICIFAPVVEEFIFRGCILNILKPFGSWFAIVFSALSFSLLHGNIGQGFGTFVTGIFFGMAAVKTGSLHLSILMHMINNIIGFCSIAVLSFDESSPFIGLLGACVIGIIIMSVYFFITKFDRLSVEADTETELPRLKRFLLLYANPLILAYIGIQAAEIIKGIVE